VGAGLWRARRADRVMASSREARSLARAKRIHSAGFDENFGRRVVEEDRLERFADFV